MTYSPSPRGNDPPTRPPGYDQPLPPPPPRVGGALSPDAYTSWLTRVLAWLIDWLGPLIISAIGIIYFFIDASKQVTECITPESEYDLGEFCMSGNQGWTTTGLIVLLLTSLISLAFAIWNYGLKQGTTGSSIGKGIMKFKVVSEETRRPIGFAMSIVRQLAHAIDVAICYIGYLFPLWDAKRQTIADKLIKTICLPI